MSRNELVLSGVIATRDLLRYTPAGMPLLNFVLLHDSEQQEVGQAFKAQLEITVSVLGDAAVQLDRLGPGSQITLKGFLARKSRNSRQLVMRAEQFKLIDGE
ncbi:MAG: primosomal replication protein N [Betaproteobacteria bacterium]|nr:primosomal replication protein N [Betaproteobacteria bacterium]